MPQTLVNMSIRMKLGFVLGLLAMLLGITLIYTVTTSQRFGADAELIQITGDLRATMTRIELLTRQITTSELANQDAVLAVSDRFQTLEELARNVSHFFIVSENVTRVQFSRFLNTLDADRAYAAIFPSIQQIAFASHVTGMERAAFENSVSVREHFEYSIYELDANSRPTPAPAHDDYLPIHYIVPFESNRSLMGFNITSNPVIKAALDQAGSTGQPAISALTPLDPAKSAVLHVVAPAFTSYTSAGGANTSQDDLKGFVVVTIDPQSLISSAAAQSGSDTTIIHIEDVTASEAPVSLYDNSGVAPNGQTSLQKVEILGHVWDITLSQPGDSIVPRRDLQAEAAALDQRMDTLLAAVQANDFLLTGGTAPLYTRNLRTTVRSLQSRINVFLKTSDVLDLEAHTLEIQTKSTALNDQLSALLTLLLNETQARVERSIWMSWIVGGLGVLIWVGGVVTVYSILRRLHSVKRNALRLADGDLEARIPVHSRDELGQIGSTLNTMADHIQRLFQTVKDNEARYRILAENVADMITQTDAGGTFLYVSPACRSVMGYEPEEMVGANRRDYVHPDDLASGAARIAAGGETCEYRIRRKDGSFIWMEATFRPLDSGEIISVARDVTERKAAALELEAARIERERLQEQVIEAQKQAIRELSSPVIPLTDNIIIMPLVGSIDTARAHDITRSLLAGITEHRAHVAIIDVTGVPLVDSGVANHLNRTIQAARLKGTRTIVSGISAAVAETIVDLGIDWSGIQTVRDLQTGLQVALDSGRLSSNGHAALNGANGHN